MKLPKCKLTKHPCTFNCRIAISCSRLNRNFTCQTVTITCNSGSSIASEFYIIMRQRFENISDKSVMENDRYIPSDLALLSILNTDVDSRLTQIRKKTKQKLGRSMESWFINCHQATHLFRAFMFSFLSFVYLL